MAELTRNKSHKLTGNTTPVAKTLSTFFKDRNDVALAFLFGSFASGTITVRSDIDVGILFHELPDFYEINNIKEDLTSIFKREIDVVALNDASPILKMQILKSGTIVYQADNNYFTEFYGSTVSQYDDLKQIRKKSEDNILKGRIYA